MENISDVVNNIPTSTYTALGLTLAAAGVSILLQLLKKWLSLQSDKVITILFIGLSFATAALDYLLSNASDNPKVLALRTFFLAGLATPIYRFLVKPATQLLVDAKIERERKAKSVAPVVNKEVPEATGNEFSA